MGYYDPDAVRVMIETRDFDGLIISNIMVGAWLTDCGRDMDKLGVPVFSDWLSGNHTWSDWGSDDNFYDPDTYAIYLGVETNFGVSNPDDTAAILNAAFTIDDDDDSASGLSNAEAVVLAVCIIGVVSCGLGSMFLCYKRRIKKVSFSVGDDERDDEDPMDSVIQKVSVEEQYDMRQIGVSITNTNEAMEPEQEVMVEVNVT